MVMSRARVVRMIKTVMKSIILSDCLTETIAFGPFDNILRGFVFPPVFLHLKSGKKTSWLNQL